jgi:hypothetical protein
MLPLLAGAAVLILLLVILNSFAGADTKRLAKLVRKFGGVALGIAALILAVRGQFGMAFIAGSFAWALLMGQALPWPRATTGAGPRDTNARPPRSRSAMSRDEALKVLGLEEGATDDQIRAAHRRLIMQTHPDKGGSTYLAAKINEAKDVLLKG